MDYFSGVGLHSPTWREGAWVIVLAVRGPRLLFFFVKAGGYWAWWIVLMQEWARFHSFFMGPMLVQFKVQSSLFTFFTLHVLHSILFFASSLHALHLLQFFSLQARGEGHAWVDFIFTFYFNLFSYYVFLLVCARICTPSLDERLRHLCGGVELR